MRIKTGTDYKGKEMFLLFGRALSKAEYDKTPNKGIPRCKVTLKSSSDELSRIVGLYDVAEQMRSIRKGDTVIADVTDNSRDYNGKHYTEYTVNSLIVQANSASAKPVIPDLDLDSALTGERFDDISSDDIPF